jgi:hypothetical protein
LTEAAALAARCGEAGPATVVRNLEGTLDIGELRRPHPEQHLAGIKTYGLLHQVRELPNRPTPGCAEHSMPDAEGKVICGTMRDLFLVRKTAVWATAIAYAGLSGVMGILACRLRTNRGMIIGQPGLSSRC